MINYFIGSTFTMALALLIGTIGSIQWFLSIALILIGITSIILFVYLGLSAISLYGLYSTPKQSLKNSEISESEMMESMKILDNPFIPRSYNLGILLTFVFSFAHIGNEIFSFSLFMTILYILVFMSNKKMMEMLHNLTLD